MHITEIMCRVYRCTIMYRCRIKAQLVPTTKAENYENFGSTGVELWRNKVLHSSIQAHLLQMNPVSWLQFQPMTQKIHKDPTYSRNSDEHCPAKSYLWRFLEILYGYCGHYG